jgi:hypothetical protein
MGPMDDIITGCVLYLISLGVAITLVGVAVVWWIVS